MDCVSEFLHCFLLTEAVVKGEVLLSSVVKKKRENEASAGRLYRAGKKLHPAKVGRSDSSPVVLVLWAP